MLEKYYVDPWLELLARKHRAREKHCFSQLQTARDIDRAVRKERQHFLGSDFSLEKLVREGNKPAEESVVRLSRCLAQRTAFFLMQRKKQHLEQPELEEYCYNFFYYTIQLYAYGKVGGECIDDVIQMAEAHAQNPEILATILGNNLLDEREDMIDDCWNWVTEYDYSRTPNGFPKCVLAAVAVLLGVMPDPIARRKDEEDERP